MCWGGGISRDILKKLSMNLQNALNWLRCMVAWEAFVITAINVYIT
jgi:hypothetical protein